MIDLAHERTLFEEKFADLDLTVVTYMDHIEYCEPETQAAWNAWVAAKISMLPPVITSTVEWIKMSDQQPPTDPEANTNWEYLVYDTLNNRVSHDYWVCPSSGTKPFWNHYGNHVIYWAFLPLPHPKF